MSRLLIKKIAQEQHLTQKDLAARSGVTAQLINRYWNNHTQSVALDQLTKIARALGVKPGDLIEETEEAAHV